MPFQAPQDVPEILRQALFGCEILRRAGIPADDIYVFLQNGELGLNVMTQGKQYAFTIAATELTKDTLGPAWLDAVNLWNATADGPDGRENPAWKMRESCIWSNIPVILAGLHRAGIMTCIGGWN